MATRKAALVELVVELVMGLELELESELELELVLVLVLVLQAYSCRRRPALQALLLTKPAKIYFSLIHPHRI